MRYILFSISIIKESGCTRKQSDSSIESNESYDDHSGKFESREGKDNFKNSHNLSLPIKHEDIFSNRDSRDIQIQEEPWYTAHNGLRYASWDKSPNRTFLRNFP